MLRHNRGEMRSEGVEFLGLMRRSNELALEGGMGGERMDKTKLRQQQARLQHWILQGVIRMLHERLNGWAVPIEGRIKK